MIETRTHKDRGIEMALTLVDQLERQSAHQAIEGAREDFGLSYEDIADVLDVDRRTLYRYRKEMNTPSKEVRNQLDTLRHISHLLDMIFINRDDGLSWLYTPVPLLQGRRPIDLIRKGELDEVLSVLAGDYSGAFV